MFAKDFAVGQPPETWQEWVTYLSMGLHGRSQWRLPVVMSGMLLAGGRRTVTSWLRAAGVGAGFKRFYYFISSVGRRVETLVLLMLDLLLKQLPGKRVLLAIDDTHTEHVGPEVQGAGLHRNPVSRPDDHKYVYGHVWVVLAWVAQHPWWGAIALPVWAKLYVKQKDLPKLNEKHPRQPWRFCTKLELAVQMLSSVIPKLKKAGKQVWVTADGAYACRPFLKPVLEMGVTVVSRLRRDAGLRTLPTKAEMKKSKGRRKYGGKAISLAKRAAHRQGWSSITCTLYGRTQTRIYKTFLATYNVVGGTIRVVIVKDSQGWDAFFCTDPHAAVEQILETYANRSTIEQLFSEVKEIWGASQQQVRNVWCIVGCFHLNLWSHTLTELWAWRRKKRTICNRDDSPWDDADRRPSHNDRRKALRRAMIQNAMSGGHKKSLNKRQLRNIIKYLTRLAA